MKLTNFILSNRRYIIFSAVFFALAFAWISNVPLTGDDWMWGSYQGVNLLKDLFQGYNGRYSGNLLIMAITRSSFFRCTLFASVMLFIALVPCLLLKKKSLSLMTFSALTVLLIPKSVMVQGLVWSSAFANYVPPVAIMMMFFIIERDTIEKRAPVYTKKRTAICSCILALFGFIGAMFLETATLCNLFMCACLVAVTLIKHKRVYITHLAFFVGTAVGAFLLFSNSKNESYRVFPEMENIMNIFYDRTTQIVNQLFTEGIFLFVIITALCMVIAASAFKSKDGVLRGFTLAIACINVFTLVLLLMSGYGSGWVMFYGNSDASAVALGFFAVLYCLSAFILLILCVKDRVVLLKLLLCMVSAAVLIAPMLIIDPYGPRCLLPTCLCVGFFATILLDYAYSVCPSFESIKGAVRVLTVSAICAAFIYIMSIYSAIDEYADKRDEYFFKQIDQGYTTITTCYLPNSSYLWNSNVENGYWGELYQFYNKCFENITYKPLSPEDFDAWAEEFDKNQ